jgi:uncharacterized protein
VAFLCAAPALDILPIIYTFRLLGSNLGWARLVGGCVLSVVLGLSMSFIFPDENKETKTDLTAGLPQVEENKSWWMQAVFFGLLIAMMILTTANSWLVSGILLVVLVVFFWRFYSREDLEAWLRASLQFVRTILPWLLIGSVGATLIYLFLPSSLVTQYSGGNSILSCLIASVFGALNYLCPPSEVLFTRAFLDLGMGHGPALAFILTGPAVSLPSILALMKIIGAKQALVYTGLLVVLSTIMGYIYGLIVM